MRPDLLVTSSDLLPLDLRAYFVPVGVRPKAFLQIVIHGRQQGSFVFMFFYSPLVAGSLIIQRSDLRSCS
jgi:hypothetical protein